MKFNHHRAGVALYVLVLLALAAMLGFVLVLAWQQAPPIAVWFTLLIAVPLIAGFWPDKKE